MVRDRANPRFEKAFQALEAAVAAGDADCGDLGLAIDREGSWSYRGSPIQRPGLVKLFASVLHRTGDGRYWLVTPGERGVVDVADVPFVAVALTVAGEGPERTVRLGTNLDEWVTVGPAHPLRLGPQPDGSIAPYVAVRDGLEARLARPVFYELVEHGEETPAGFGIWSQGAFFVLGTT